MSNVSSATIAEQIENAKKAAADLANNAAPPSTGTAVSTQTTTTAVATPSAAGQRMGLAAFMSAGNADADGFIKIGEAGVKFGKDLTGYQGVEFILDLAKDARFFYTISYGNAPAIYKRSQDGLTCTDGGTWAQAVENALKVDPRVRPYESAELVLELVKDVKTAKGVVVAEAGSRWGYSTPKTGSKKFRRLLNEAIAVGIDVENGDILIKVGGEPKAGNGNTWAEITFELVGPGSIQG